MKKRLSKCLAFMFAIVLSVITAVTPIAQAATSESTEIETDATMEVSTENSPLSLEEATLDTSEEEQKAEVASQTATSTLEQTQETDGTDMQWEENNSAMEAPEESQEAVEISEEMTAAEETILVEEEEKVEQKTTIEEENITEPQQEDALSESQMDTISNVPDITEEEGNFLEWYKANLAFEEGGNPVNNGVYPYKDSILMYHEIGHASEILMRDLNKTDRFMNNLKMYELWTIDPSKFAGELTGQSDFYMAILLSMLNIATTSDKTLEFCNSKWKKIAAQSSSWIIKGMKEQYNITISPGVKLADVDRDKLKFSFQKMLKDKYNMADSATQGLTFFNYYMDTLTTVQEMINAISAYTCIYQMQEDTFDVLREMQKHTSDLDMKKALERIILCENDSLMTISGAMMECGTDVFESLYKNVVGSMWTGIALSSPFAPVYIAQKTASALCDFCLSTDAISEQYWKMDAMCKVEKVLYDSSVDLGKKFIDSQTVENARNYNRSIELYFNLYEESGEYAKTFADIIFKNSLGGIVSDQEGYKKFIEDTTKLQGNAKTSYKVLEDAYKNYLEEDYPDKKNEFDDDTEYVAVSGISIKEDAIEWDMNGGELWPTLSYDIMPSNADDQRVQYTISDESIVSYRGDGLFVMHKPGTVVVTVTTMDGGYSDSVTINVVEGQRKETAWTSTPVNVVGSGTCGGNVSWYLVDNGKFYINGKEKMKELTHERSAPWYKYRELIKKVNIQEGITKIGDFAFLACNNLSEIEIPNSVEEIGYKTFSGCSSLRKIKIPNNVTYIHKYAFSGCSSLSEIEIPNSATCIREFAFSGCSSLRKIKIPNGMPDIGPYLFSGCSSLSRIEIRNGVEVIYSYAFDGCSSLNEIEIPNSVKTIYKCAFNSCSGLDKIEIPSSVTSIGARAFDNCSSLSEIRILNKKCAIYNNDATISPTAVIYGYKDSTAETYATKYNREFQVLEEVQPCIHTYKAEVTKEPTCTEEGITTYTCTQCGESYTESIAALGHDFREAEKKTPTCMTEGSITKECSRCKEKQTEILEATKDITNCTASLSKISYIYDGKAKEPIVTLKDGEVIVPTSAYKVNYSNNIEIGEAVVTINGINDYKGKLETHFNIQSDGYTITYNANGGKNAPSAQTKKKGVTLILSKTKPTRKGYTFLGWATSKSSTKVSYKAGASFKSDKNTTLYAVWKANAYKIAFNKNGGKGNMTTISCTYGKSYTLKANAFSRTGYTFKGWNTKADGTGTYSYADKAMVKNVSSVAGKTITLYAQWTPKKYKITYQLNGGKNNKANPEYYQITNATITLKNPTRKGYTFVGWYTSSSYRTKVTKITKGSTGSKTFYARWTANRYKVAFDKNGGTGSMSTVSCVYDKTFTLKANTFKRKGYTFKGWNTKADGTGTYSYADKAKVKNISSVAGKTIKLFAQWEPNKYTLRYDGNGATSGSMEDTKDCQYDKSYTLRENAFEREGYTFIGWAKSAKGALRYKDAEEVTNISSVNGKVVVLYAVWEKNE